MENRKSLNAEPVLADPGAGIGLLEMLFLKFYIKPFLMKKLTKADALRSLAEGQAKITEQIRVFKPEDLTKRILVKRPYFVEDSSRHWSAAMLCNHLGKVNGALAKAIESKFTAKPGPDYNGKDRLKAVKPEVEKNRVQEIEIFQQSVERIQKVFLEQSEIDLNSRLIPHPWLGNLTYIQWVWFAGAHMKVHARQLHQIYRGANSPSFLGQGA